MGLDPRPKSMSTVCANHGGKLRRAAAACGRSGSGAEWLSVPMRIGGGGGAFYVANGQLKGPLAVEEPQGAKIRY